MFHISDDLIRESVIRMTNARKRMRDLAPIKDGHVCSPHVCLPLNEVAFIGRGLIAPPTICEFVYLCRFGNVHVCTPNTCTLFLENKHGVCPISGIQYQSAQQTDYDKEDWRTWYQKPQTKSIKQSVTHNVVHKKRKTRRELLGLDNPKEDKSEGINLEEEAKAARNSSSDKSRSW